MSKHVCRHLFESRSAHGYTLIELMIVMSIISILASISIPQYVNYAVRARWSDNIVRVGAAQDGNRGVCTVQQQYGQRNHLQ